jgi:hypothetical protein
MSCAFLQTHGGTGIKKQSDSRDSQVANDCQAHHHMLGITVSILLLRFLMVLTEMFLRRPADFKGFLPAIYMAMGEATAYQ